MFTVRCEIRETDLPKIATIHKNIFQGHFLAKLPEKMLMKYYKEFWIEKAKVNFILIENDNNVLGFVMGGEAEIINKAKNRFIKRNSLRLLYYSLFHAFGYLLKKLFSRAQYKQVGDSFLVSPSFRLLSIDVRKDMQGAGIASLLVDSYEQALPSYIDAYGLSVHKNNSRAISFYKKKGLQICGECGDSYYLAKRIR